MREDEPLQLRRKDFEQHRAQAHHRGHDGDGGVERVLRLFVPPFRGVARVDGNEGDGRGATRENVVEEVRQVKGADVGIGIQAGAEGPRDVGLAQVADHP